MYIPVINLLQTFLPSFTKKFAFDFGADLLNLQDSNQSFAFLTRYRDAPQVPCVSKDLPSDCNVTQIILVRVKPRVCIFVNHVTPNSSCTAMVLVALQKRTTNTSRALFEL